MSLTDELSTPHVSSSATNSSCERQAKVFKILKVSYQKIQKSWLYKQFSKTFDKFDHMLICL